MLERWRAALAAGAAFEMEFPLRRADGSLRWFLSRATPLRGSDGSVVRWYGTQTDIQDQKDAEARARFLAEASHQLATSLDYEETLRQVARLAVPQFADWVAVDMLGADGEIKRVAVEHVDPAKVELARERAVRYPARRDEPGGVGKVLRTLQSDFIAEIPDALRVQLIPDQVLLKISASSR